MCQICYISHNIIVSSAYAVLHMALKCIIFQKVNSQFYGLAFSFWKTNHQSVCNQPKQAQKIYSERHRSLWSHVMTHNDNAVWSLVTFSSCVGGHCLRCGGVSCCSSPHVARSCLGCGPGCGDGGCSCAKRGSCVRRRSSCGAMSCCSCGVTDSCGASSCGGSCHGSSWSSWYLAWPSSVGRCPASLPPHQLHDKSKWKTWLLSQRRIGQHDKQQQVNNAKKLTMQQDNAKRWNGNIEKPLDKHTK